jgi:hypothetical protein
MKDHDGQADPTLPPPGGERPLAMILNYEFITHIELTS